MNNTYRTNAAMLQAYGTMFDASEYPVSQTVRDDEPPDRIDQAFANTTTTSAPTLKRQAAPTPARSEE